MSGLRTTVGRLKTTFFEGNIVYKDTDQITRRKSYTDGRRGSSMEQNTAPKEYVEYREIIQSLEDDE